MACKGPGLQIHVYLKWTITINVCPFAHLNWILRNVFLKRIQNQTNEGEDLPMNISLSMEMNKQPSL